MDSVAAKLLYERGIHSAEELHTFLQPSLEDLHDPYLLHDMDKAVERIRRAIEDYEQILIYGDYDADGMTSASILKETLEEMGQKSKFIFPTVSQMAMGRISQFTSILSSKEGISLIVTVDNGVAGHEAIAYAHKWVSMLS